MATGEAAIKLDIHTLMLTHGGEPHDYYVGISSNPVVRLAQGHGVKLDQDPFVRPEASSAQVARAVKKYFVEEVGTDGGTGGGDQTGKHVYGYKKQAHTDP